MPGPCLAKEAHFLAHLCRYTVRVKSYINLDIDSEETILAKIDDVRLLESRKSARLVNSDTDFSKLADINISMTANDKRRQQHNSGNSSVSSANSSSGRSNAIEVPRSDYVQIAGSRKRR